MTSFSDSRDKATIQLHSDIAKATLDGHMAAFRKVIDSNPKLMTDSIERLLISQTQYTYHVACLLQGLIYINVDVTFQDWDSSNFVGHFLGHSGGLAIGGGPTFGTAWFNYPIETLIGQDARFQGNFIVPTTNLNWWKMSGEPIGSYVGGGVNIGSGIIGGQGNFDLKHS